MSRNILGMTPTGLFCLMSFVGLVAFGLPAQSQSFDSEDDVLELQLEGVGTSPLTFFQGPGFQFSVEPSADGIGRPVVSSPGFTEIVVRRPYTGRDDWFDWAKAVRDSLGTATPIPRTRASIVVRDLSGPQGGSTENRWSCFECFPKHWKVSGELELTEEMVIVVEWFEEA